MHFSTNTCFLGLKNLETSLQNPSPEFWKILMRIGFEFEIMINHKKKEKHVFFLFAFVLYLLSKSIHPPPKKIRILWIPVRILGQFVELWAKLIFGKNLFFRFEKSWDVLTKSFAGIVGKFDEGWIWVWAHGKSIEKNRFRVFPICICIVFAFKINPPKRRKNHKTLWNLIRILGQFVEFKTTSNFTKCDFCIIFAINTNTLANKTIRILWIPARISFVAFWPKSSFGKHVFFRFEKSGDVRPYKILCRFSR